MRKKKQKKVFGHIKLKPASKSMADVKKKLPSLVLKKKSRKNAKRRNAVNTVMIVFSAASFIVSATMYVISIFFFNDTMILQFSYTIPAWTILSVIFFICLVLSFAMFNTVISLRADERLNRTLQGFRDDINSLRRSIERLDGNVMFLSSNIHDEQDKENEESVPESKEEQATEDAESITEDDQTKEWKE